MKAIPAEPRDGSATIIDLKTRKRIEPAPAEPVKASTDTLTDSLLQSIAAIVFAAVVAEANRQKDGTNG